MNERSLSQYFVFKCLTNQIYTLQCSNWTQILLCSIINYIYEKGRQKLLHLYHTQEILILLYSYLNEV